MIFEKIEPNRNGLFFGYMDQEISYFEENVEANFRPKWIAVVIKLAQNPVKRCSSSEPLEEDAPYHRRQ